MRSNEERGVALVVAVMAMTLLLALGAALILISSSETMIAANFSTGEEAIYAADAALDAALGDLKGIAGWSQVLDGSIRSPFADGAPGGTRAIAGGGLLDLDAVVNLVNCGKRAPCTNAEINASTAERPWGANNPRWRLFAYGWLDDLAGGPLQASPFYVIALVADDGSENDDDAGVDGASIGYLPNPGRGIVRARAEAFGPRASRYVVEATVERFLVDELDPTGPTGLRLLSRREVHSRPVHAESVPIAGARRPDRKARRASLLGISKR